MPNTKTTVTMTLDHDQLAAIAAALQLLIVSENGGQACQGLSCGHIACELFDRVEPMFGVAFGLNCECCDVWWDRQNLPVGTVYATGPDGRIEAILHCECCR